MRSCVLAICVFIGLASQVFALDSTLVVPQFVKPASAPADDDPFKAKYEAAWSRYEEAIAKVTETVNKALDGLFNKAADAGNLDLADMWDKKKRDFADTRSIEWPADGKAKTEWRKKFPDSDFPDDFTEVVKAAQEAYAAAVTALKDDYESLVKDYTKERNLGRAKQLRDEVAGLERKPVVQPERPRVAVAKPQPKDVAVQDIEAIQGEWEAVSADVSGAAMDAATIQRMNRRLTIKGNTFREEMLRDGKIVGAEGKFTLTPKTNAFDFVGSHIGRPDLALEYVGVYDLDGDVLRLCCRANVDGRATRPNGFRSDGSKPNWSHNYVYRKVRK